MDSMHILDDSCHVTSCYVISYCHDMTRPIMLYIVMSYHVMTCYALYDGCNDAL